MKNRTKKNGENSTAAIPFLSRITIRFMLTVGLAMGILLAAIFLFISDRAREQIISEIHKQAAIAFEQVVITRHWNTEYGGVYVEKTEGVESNPYLEKLGIDPDIISVESRKYTLKNPALMTRELSDIAKQGKVLEFHITSLDFVNPSNAPDAFEKTALMSFEKGDTEANRIVRRNALMSYQYMAPLYAEKGCLKCHKKYNPGDVRGGISVFLPMQEAYTAIQSTKRNLFAAGMGLIFGIEILLFFLINRLVVRPMNELRVGAIKMGDGDLEYRIPVKRKDEIGVVGTAFNTMASDMAENARIVSESEAKFQAIFSESLEGIALVDGESGYIRDCNPAFEQQTGRKLDDLKKMKIWEIRPPEKADAARDKFHEIVEKGIGGSDELAFQKPDGRIVPMEFVSKMVTIQGKQYVLSTTRELTKRKQAEDTLRQNLKEMTALNTLGRQVSASLSLNQVVQSVIDGMVMAANPDLALLFLREDNSLLLQGAGPKTSKYTHGETHVHQVGECLCGLAVTEGKPIYSVNIHNDPRCTWTECKKAGLHSFVALPLRSANQIIGVLGLASGTERDFREQASFLETLSNQTAIGLQNALLHEELERHAAGLEERVNERTAELEEKNEQLEQFNKLFVGRELRMAELKEKIDILEKELAAKRGDQT